MKNRVLYYFREISKIPRETYHVDKIADYLVEFAKKNELEYIRDKYNNVILIKEASSEYSNVESIILQAHIDMVCQKRDDIIHDFRKDGIEIIEEVDYLKANGTTLGADDGIGMAIILAILDSDEPLGKIEAIFTANEEVGMDGALNLDMSVLNSKYLINLDSEEEGIITAGCAGGVRVEVSLPIKREFKEGKVLTITISNLLGGHSGVDINKNRINAITFIGNILKNENCCLIDINGGKVDNAIADNVLVKILVTKNYDENRLLNKIKNELNLGNEKEAIVSIDCDNSNESIIVNSSKYLDYLSNIPNGVMSYEEGLDDMVKTSLNMGVVESSNDLIKIKHLIRSSNINEQNELVENIKKEVNILGGDAITSSEYPGWEYDNNSKLRELLKRVYFENTNRKLKVEVIHAGLECGILKSKKPNLDCVSIGPNIYDVHTPNEKVELRSVLRTYEFVLEVLRRMGEIT